MNMYTDNDTTRHHNEAEFDSNHDYRSLFRRDLARIVHSHGFRRLDGKTQLFPQYESDFFRNRLSHSLEVAQIAKSIALKINQGLDEKYKIDLDLVELAGFAHDLGHPPFGHQGEEILAECMREHGGFEGNAQTLRLLAKLEKKKMPNLQCLVIQHCHQRLVSLHLPPSYPCPSSVSRDTRSTRFP